MGRSGKCHQEGGRGEGWPCKSPPPTPLRAAYAPPGRVVTCTQAFAAVTVKPGARAPFSSWKCKGRGVRRKGLAGHPAFAELRVVAACALTAVAAPPRPASPGEGREGPAEVSRVGWVPAAAAGRCGGRGRAPSQLVPQPQPEAPGVPQGCIAREQTLSRTVRITCSATCHDAHLKAERVFLGPRWSREMVSCPQGTLGVTRGGAGEKGRTKGQSGLDI